MTHQEFLDLVTPKDVQGYAAFSNAQGMVVAATSIGLQWALQKALDKFKDAKNERAKEAAQKEGAGRAGRASQARAGKRACPTSSPDSSTSPPLNPFLPVSSPLPNSEATLGPVSSSSEFRATLGPAT